MLSTSSKRLYTQLLGLQFAKKCFASCLTVIKDLIKPIITLWHFLYSLKAKGSFVLFTNEPY